MNAISYAHDLEEQINRNETINIIPENTITLLTAVAYARFSSDNQREESIDAQLRAISEYANKHSIRIVKIYTDEARSATTTDSRDSFLRMIDEIHKGIVKVNLCLIHKYDRFARDDYDHVVNERKLQNKNVRLLAVEQPVDNSPEGNLTKHMLVGLAKYYSQNLARETMKGLKENALKAKHCGGIPPLGYDLDENKNYVINENEAKTVRLIFEMKLSGAGYSEMISRLAENGMKTKRGQPFGKNSIHDILINEKYTGTFIYNKGTAKDHRQVRECDIIKIANAIPQIIDTDTWNRVQAMMKDNKHTCPRRRGIMRYILTGKLFCQECGGAYVGNSRKGGKAKKQYYYYSCNTRMRGKECKNKEIRKELLEDAILDRIQDIFFSEDVNCWADKLEKLYIEQTEGTIEEEQKTKDELAKTKKHNQFI
mgnify:CR=1 FL=1